MPSLPGTGQPLAIMCGGSSKAKSRGKGGRKGKTTSTSKGNQDVSPPRKRVRGDEELLQLDLKRKAHVLQTNVVTRLTRLQFFNYIFISHLCDIWLNRFCLLNFNLRRVNWSLWARSSRSRWESPKVLRIWLIIENLFSLDGTKSKHFIPVELQQNFLQGHAKFDKTSMSLSMVNSMNSIFVTFRRSSKECFNWFPMLQKVCIMFTVNCVPVLSFWLFIYFCFSS